MGDAVFAGVYQICGFLTVQEVKHTFPALGLIGSSWSDSDGRSVSSERESSLDLLYSSLSDVGLATPDILL